eukprot:1192232-Prorocentrum_minimum.AAC.2
MTLCALACHGCSWGPRVEKEVTKSALARPPLIFANICGRTVRLCGSDIYKRKTQDVEMLNSHPAVVVKQDCLAPGTLITFVVNVGRDERSKKIEQRALHSKLLLLMQ